MNNPSGIINFTRFIFVGIESVGYFLVSGAYNIFFTVANAQLFSGDIINTFYSRIQLILAVLMTFKIAITLLNIIINPDSFKDKEKGPGKLITRIVVSLVLLTLIVPIPNIPKSSNPLNEQIRSNGILFGFLYQFQNSVMDDNILGKLILGSNVGSVDDADNISNLGGTLATTVAKTFITPTLSVDDDEVSGTELNKSQVACPSALDEYGYNNSNLHYSTLIDNINETCDSSGMGEVYVFNYIPFGGLICSLIMTFIILGFTIDVAVRAIKLAVLRLIAPVPIISYIMPGSEKNGAFGNWVKSLSSTYIDLFLRIAVIYFGAYIIYIIAFSGEDGINIWQGSSSFTVSLLSTVFIIIGVLIFMKEAPKFFKDMLGIKGDGGNFFRGIGTMLGAAALTGGLAGSVATGVRAGWQEGAEYKGRTAGLRRVLGAGVAGLTSGVGGAVVGAGALMSADKKQAGAVFSAMQKRNAMRAAHSTLLGRATSGAYGMFTGRSLAERDQQILDATNDAKKGISSWNEAATDEALKQTGADDYGITTINGKKYGFNWDTLEAAMKGANQDGYFYYGNNRFNLTDFSKTRIDEIKKSQTSRFVARQYNRKTGHFDNPRLETEWKLAAPKIEKANLDYSDFKATYVDDDGNSYELPFLDPSSKGAMLGKADSQIEQYTNNMKHVKHMANHNQSK